MADAGDHSRHVLVVPSAAEDHINGMLRFATLLASSFHHQGLLVSFGYPARFHALALKRNKLSALPPSLRLHNIDDGLPTAEHESPTIPQFKSSPAIASKACADNDCGGVMNEKGSSDTSLMESSWPPVCCIISDTFLPDTHDLAGKFGIPRVDLWTGNATTYNMITYLPQIISRGMLPLPEGAGGKWKVEAPLIDFVPGLRPFHLTELPNMLLETSDISHPRYQFMLKAFAHANDADRILVHSVYELESSVYDTMQAQGFPIFSLGPLFEGSLLDSGTVGGSECLEWLDQQKPASGVCSFWYSCKVQFTRDEVYGSRARSKWSSFPLGHPDGLSLLLIFMKAYRMVFGRELSHRVRAVL
ncbi:hypothetical protein L7F22_037678 [Adiantum nelumboides]|nr:hypothetical protein [Adiantum nelumboides]